MKSEKEKKGRGAVDLKEIENLKLGGRIGGIVSFSAGAIFALFFGNSYESLGLALLFFTLSIIFLNRTSYWDWKWNYIKDKEVKK